MKTPITIIIDDMQLAYSIEDIIMDKQKLTRELTYAIEKHIKRLNEVMRETLDYNFSDYDN